MVSSKSGIYWIKCLVNNKIYIGSTKNFKRRWKGNPSHRSSLRKNIHYNQYLQNAWNKYGEDNFVFEELEYVPEEGLLLREQHYLDNFIIWDFDYNICKKAGNTLGIRLSKESIMKFSRENHYSTNFVEEDIEDIRESYMEGFSQFELSQKYEVSRSAIQGIISNRTWYDEDYDPKQKREQKSFKGENNPASKLKKFQVTKIRDLYKTGNYTIKKLAQKYDVHFDTIYKIVLNKTYYDENYVYEIREDQCGENNPATNSTWNIVNEMREKYKSGGYSYNKLVKEYDMPLATVQGIINGTRWYDEEYEPPTEIENKFYKKLSYVIAEVIREERNNGVSVKELMKEHKVGKATILKIINKKTYKNP